MVRTILVATLLDMLPRSEPGVFGIISREKVAI